MSTLLAILYTVMRATLSIIATSMVVRSSLPVTGLVLRSVLDSINLTRSLRIRNCQSPDGGWALGCRIDGGQAEFVRVPYADQGLNRIPDSVTDEQALFVGDILATGYWAARISEIKEEDMVLIIGAGPTGICTLLCVMLKHPKHIIVCEKSEERRAFVKEHYPEVIVTTPEECTACTGAYGAPLGGADVVIEVAGSEDSFQLAWQSARPNAIVTVVALYDRPQILPLPDMYGKNLTFKTGGVDGCDCAEIPSLIEQGLIDTTPLITQYSQQLRLLQHLLATHRL